MLPFKQGIDDGQRSRTDRPRATEVDVAVRALNRILELGRPVPVRIARTLDGIGVIAPIPLILAARPPGDAGRVFSRRSETA